MRRGSARGERLVLAMGGLGLRCLTLRTIRRTMMACSLLRGERGVRGLVDLASRASGELLVPDGAGG